MSNGKDRVEGGEGPDKIGAAAMGIYADRLCEDAVYMCPFVKPEVRRRQCKIEILLSVYAEA